MSVPRCVERSQALTRMAESARSRASVIAEGLPVTRGDIDLRDDRRIGQGAVQAEVSNVEAQPFVVIRPARKRLDGPIDRAIACGLLVATAPALVVIALLIWLEDRGPVLFRQEREGRNGRPFIVFKFRTMSVDNDDRAHRELVRREYFEPEADSGTSDGVFKLENDPRVTRVGRWLRATSVDEVPQLLNVARGEMALVGPRPLTLYETAMHSERHRQRSVVRPGLTGLWQVSGRNHLTMAHMLELDLEYAAQRSWRLDLTILAKTPGAVLRGAR